MSDERRFAVAGIEFHLNQAPPVYAPGGPVAFTQGLPEGAGADAVDAAEQEAARRGAVLVIIQCLTSNTAHEELLLSRGYTYASAWYAGPTAADEPTPPQIRTATAADVPKLLEIGERKREQYDTFSPVFWKKAPTPREEFAPYVTMQVESDQNVALVYEDQGEMRGYLIAQCRNLADGYVDDYAVADPVVDWPGAGRSLLVEATRQARERGVTAFTIVTGHADVPKRAAIASLGYTHVKNWLVKPIPPQSK